MRNYIILLVIGIVSAQSVLLAGTPKSQGCENQARNYAGVGCLEPEEAAWRSAVLPGWGQFKQGRFAASAVYAGSVLAIAGMANNLSRDMAVARQTYRDAARTALLFSYQTGASFDSTAFMFSTLERNRARDQYKLSVHRFDTAKLLLAGIWAWNVLDTILFQPSEDSYVNLKGSGDKLNLGYTRKF